MARTARKPTYDDFVHLADRHVSVHLRRLGYGRVGPAEELPDGAAAEAADGSRGLLVRLGSKLGLGRRGGPEPVAWSMRYEALSEAAQLTVDPAEPEEVREVVLRLTRATGELALRLDRPLPELVAEHGNEEGDADVLDVERPLAERLERLDGVLGEFVHSRLRP